MPQADIWQAVALSMGLEPGDEYDDFVPTDSQESEYDQRILLVNAHVMRELLPVLALPPRRQYGRVEFAIVDLRTFGTFAKRIGIPVPPEFPFDPVNWDKWGRADVAEVWQAVAIATQYSPDGVKFREAKSSLGRDFNEMLEVAMRCLGSSLPIHSQDEGTVFDGFAEDPITLERRTKVHLPTFREWAEGKGYALPRRFPRAINVPDPAQPTVEKSVEVAPAQSPLKDQVQSSRWPWGAYETKLLIELSEAARHFWTEYKPGLPATAPTNDEVRDWLIRRRVPQRKAEVMAQILRADDLPPGPHVNK
jgi:hypothetical protein